MRLASRNTPAFTLLETLIAFGIFSLVVSSITAVFISTLRIQRQSSASHAIIDSVRFSLEFMERELRTGRNFSDELGNGTVLTFTNDRGEIVRYRVNAAILERAVGGEVYEALSAPDVIVSNFRFRLRGEADTDVYQPRITLSFKAGSRLDSSVVLSMATTVSQRDVDIKR